MKKIGKILSIFVFFIGLSFYGFSQEDANPKVVDLCKKAKHEINTRNFDKAQSYLKKAKKIDSTFADIYIIEGDIYNFSLESKKSGRMLQQGYPFSERPQTNLILRYGE